MSYPRKTANRPWTTADFEAVETLLKKGLNPGQIGPKIGRSRNAVCGMIWRTPNLQQAMKERIEKMNRKEPEQPPFKASPEDYDRAALNVTLIELNANQCRYIAGDDRLFCGWPQRPGSMYCPHHALRCETARR